MVRAFTSEGAGKVYLNISALLLILAGYSSTSVAELRTEMGQSHPSFMRQAFTEDCYVPALA